MKLTINTKELKIAIAPIKKLNKKTNVYILSNILLYADKESQELILTSTDLEICIKTQIKAKVESEGKVLIPFKNLEKLAELKEENIDIELIPADINTKQPEQLKIYKLKLNTYDINEYPEYPIFEIPKTILRDLNLTSFKKALQKTNPYLSTDPSRVILTGFYCDLANSKIVATDSYKLALHDFDFNHIDYYNSTEPENRHLPQLNFVLPQRIYQILNTIKEKPDQVFNLTLEAEKEKYSDPEKPPVYKTTNIKISTNNIVITAHVYQGKYPDYQRIMPQKDAYRTVISLKSQDLINTLTEVEKLLSMDNIPVKLMVDDKKEQLKVEMNVRETGNFEDTLPIDIIKASNFKFNVIDNENEIRTTEETLEEAQAWINLHKDYYKKDDGSYYTYTIKECQDNEPLEIAFNPSFLKTCITETENVVISIIQPLKPVMITDPDVTDFVTLLMPIKIS